MAITLNGTTGEVFPTWTTATRPASPSTSQTGYNTSIGSLETYNGTSWTNTVNTQGGFRSSATAYYTGYGIGSSAASTITLTTNRVYYENFVVGQTTTFTKIGLRVTTAEAAKVARLGIYNWSSGIPTTLLLDAGTVSLAATGEVEASISQSLGPGNYALAFISDATTAALRAATLSVSLSCFQYGLNDTNSATNTGAFYEAGTGTTLPTTATTNPTNLTATVPLIYMRV
jgi:hypothetical protein